MFNEREKRDMRKPEFFNRELRTIKAALRRLNHIENYPLSQAAIDLIRSIDDREKEACNAKMKVKVNAK